MKLARTPSGLCALMTFALMLPACDEDGRRPGSSPTAPIAPPLQTHTLAGRVVEGTAQGARPIAGARILINIFPPPGIFPRPSSSRSSVSDSEGRYVVGDLPHRHAVVLTAGSPYVRGRLQPCAAPATMDADAVLDVELVSSATAPRTIHGSPTISGVVHEFSAEGRRPISGASVGYEAVCWTGEFPHAWTETDSSGRYELCRLPSADIADSGCIVAFAAGRSAASRLLDVRGDMVIDIDLSPPPPSHR